MSIPYYEQVISKSKMLGYRVVAENDEFVVLRNDTLSVISKQTGKITQTNCRVVMNTGVIELSNRFVDDDNNCYIFATECGKDKIIYGPYRNKVLTARFCPIYVITEPDYTMTVYSRKTTRKLKVEAYDDMLDFMLRKPYMVYARPASPNGGIEFCLRPQDYTQLGIVFDEELNIIDVAGGLKVKVLEAFR